eukprot:4363334-Pyramimonas_sp.AAC.1
MYVDMGSLEGVASTEREPVRLPELEHKTAVAHNKDKKARRGIGGRIGRGLGGGQSVKIARKEKAKREFQLARR